MSDEIKPGDLVMVVRPMLCCGKSSGLGYVGTAEAIPINCYGAKCSFCGDENRDFRRHFMVDGKIVHALRLKKIDPPALADEVEREREVEAA